MERGYAATTLQEIAERAGISVQSVYFHFGSKPALLKEVIDVASAGDDEPVAVLDRPWMEEIRQAGDGAEMVRLWCAATRSIFERAAAVMGVVLEAAGADPAAREQWEVNRDQRLIAYTTFVDLLADHGVLDPALDRDEAIDLTFALLSPELFLILTRDRRWTPRRWEEHLRELLSATLL